MKTVVRSDERFLPSDIFDRDQQHAAARLRAHARAGRDIPIYHRCDVLVVGGGPSGTAPPPPRRGKAPTSCCSSATIIWAAFRPAAW